MTPILTLPRADEAPEADRRGECPHPREMLSLVGHRDIEAQLLAGYRDRRLPHGLIFAGPEGIGKATLAYRLARFILAHPDPAGEKVYQAKDLGVEARSPAAALIGAGAHPDFVALRRAYDPKTKRLRGSIGVEDVRTALALFSKTAGFGGWRICIVDAADDLTIASANALLKTLEEPPPQSLFILVAHHAQRLLPTIRSRCRLIRFGPLAQEEIAALTRQLSPDLADLPAGSHAQAAAAAEGSVARALALLDPAEAALRARIDAILAALPRRDGAAIDALAEAVAGREGEGAFALLIDRLEDWMQARLHALARLPDGAARLAPVTELWDKLAEQSRAVETLNLDRRPYVQRLMAEVADVARRLSA